jgi:hypothetical protein
MMNDWQKPRGYIRMWGIFSRRNGRTHKLAARVFALSTIGFFAAYGFCIGAFGSPISAICLMVEWPQVGQTP